MPPTIGGPAVNSYKCMYCKTFVDTKVKSNSKNQSTKRGGLGSLIQAIIEKLSVDEFTYVSNVKEIQCNGICKKHYIILCDSPGHCCEVLQSNNIVPFNYRPKRMQELKTEIARRGLDKGISCDDIRGITRNLDQDMINVVLEQAVLVLSEENGGSGNGWYYLLEDIQ